MEQAIQLDNEAIAQNNTAYWENLSDQVKLRDGFIRDQEYLMAYALYQFNYIETPIYATGQALIQQEITEEQLYSQLNAWTLADQLVYPIVDFVGLIPGVDIGADLVGFFYAQLRGDMQQAPLYAMALMLPPGLDNMAKYGGRGSSHVVAVYTANGITYVPKLADEPIDEAVEAVRASVLTHDPVIAQAIIDVDGPYIFHEADELYKSRHRAIYQGTGNDLAKAKLITGEIADHCPLLLANPQLVTKELSEVLAGIPEAADRKAFLEALDGFGDIGKMTTFVEDLANAPGLVVALKGRWELVRAWERLFKTGLRTDVHWLSIVSKWLDEGVEVIDDVLPVKFMHNGDEIATILDDKLIPEKFQFEGTVINEVKLPSQTYGKDVVKSSDGTIGFRYQFQGTKMYRAMSNEEWQVVESNNGLSIGNGTENFVSTSRAYSEGYLGRPGYDVLVEFTVQTKTIQDLAKIGVRDQSNLIKNSGFDDLVPVSSGWGATSALFKGEGTAVNIGLGSGSVGTFNGNITTIIRLN